MMSPSSDPSLAPAAGGSDGVSANLSPSVVGLARDEGCGVLAQTHRPQEATDAQNPPSPCAEALALGVGGALPPAAGGTSFGAELACAPRTRWKSRTQSVLVLMGYCIGVGNLWRFPYLCGKYGGGAFLVAYLFMLCFVAAPLFLYESVLGQKFQKGPAETFRKMSPRWTGLAYVPVVMTFFFLPYYQLIVTYALHYFLVSFQSPLPWVDGVTPDKYLEKHVLDLVPSLDAEGSADVNGMLFMELIVVWVVTVLCLIKGIHSAGKAAYVTVVLPVIMMVILFCVCIQLEGAGDGLAYYLTPRFDQLLLPEVWGLAAGQIIFSLSPGTGTCISLASYHEPDYKNLFADCVLVAVCNSAFSLFGGLVVFSVVGNLALTQHRPVEEVAASGEGLAFIVFAQGLAQFGEASSVMAALFFLTLFLLGLDSTFAIVETLQTYLNDYILSRNPSEKITTKGNAFRLVAISVTLLLVGIPYVTRGGYHLLEIADHFVVTYSLTVGVFFEYILIGYAYEAEQMLEDVHAITGVRLPACFVWQIKAVAPAVLILVVLLLLFSEGNSMSQHPAWAVFIFGVLPVCLALLAGVVPTIQFRLRRLLWGRLITPEALAAGQKRAKTGGFQTFSFTPRADASDGGGLPLADYRA